MKGSETLKHIRTYFFTGLLVVIPVLLSITIFFWLFGYALRLSGWMLVFLPEDVRSPKTVTVQVVQSRNAVEVQMSNPLEANAPLQAKVLGDGRTIEVQLPPETQLAKPLEGWRRDFYTGLLNLSALVVTLVFIVLVGMTTKNVLGKRLLMLWDEVISRVPLLSKIYETVKQITETLWTSKKTVFSKVVLIEYPRPGAFAIGFITSESKGEVQERTHADVVNVFIPTTPNPTSGWLAILPRNQVTVLDMTVADGFKMVISGGSVVPPYPVNSVPSAAGNKE